MSVTLPGIRPAAVATPVGIGNNLQISEFFLKAPSNPADEYLIGGGTRVGVKPPPVNVFLLLLKYAGFQQSPFLKNQLLERFTQYSCPARDYETTLIEPELEDHNQNHEAEGRTVCEYYGQFLDQDPVYQP
jgi:hypothetical protein